MGTIRIQIATGLGIFASVGEKYKNNRSKSACTLNARKRLNNQAVWPVIFDITGPICVRALKTMIPLTLGPCGHHDWPVMSIYRKVPAWDMRSTISEW